VIYIDLLADLNLEGDQGRNVARLADVVPPDAVTQGAVSVAGAARAWSWAGVESSDGGFVYFRQISAQDAARRGSPRRLSCHLTSRRTAQAALHQPTG
jgi:hypothetical protein